MADTEMTAEEYQAAMPGSGASAPQPASVPKQIAPEHFPKFVEIARDKNTTPKKLSDWLKDNGYPTPDFNQAASFLAQTKRNPTGEITPTLGYVKAADPVAAAVAPEASVQQEAVQAPEPAPAGRPLDSVDPNILNSVIDLFTKPEYGLSPEDAHKLGGDLNTPLGLNKVLPGVADIGARLLGGMGMAVEGGAHALDSVADATGLNDTVNKALSIKGRSLGSETMGAVEALPDFGLAHGLPLAVETAMSKLKPVTGAWLGKFKSVDPETASVVEQEIASAHAQGGDVSSLTPVQVAEMAKRTKVDTKAPETPVAANDGLTGVVHDETPSPYDPVGDKPTPQTPINTKASDLPTKAPEEPKYKIMDPANDTSAPAVAYPEGVSSTDGLTNRTHGVGPDSAISDRIDQLDDLMNSHTKTHPLQKGWEDEQSSLLGAEARANAEYGKGKTPSNLNRESTLEEIAIQAEKDFNDHVSNNDDPGRFAHRNSKAYKAYEAKAKDLGKSYYDAVTNDAKTWSDEDLNIEFQKGKNSGNPYNRAVRDEWLRRGEEIQGTSFSGEPPKPPEEPPVTGGKPPKPPEETPVDRLNALLKGVDQKLEDQKAARTQEKSDRLKEGDARADTKSGIEAHRAQKSALKGQYTSATLDGTLTREDLDALVEQARNTKDFGKFDKINVGNGLERIFNGQLPRDSELALINEAFGPEITKRIMKHRDKIAKTFSSKGGQAEMFGHNEVTSTGPLRQELSPESKPEKLNKDGSPKFVDDPEQGDFFKVKKKFFDPDKPDKVPDKFLPEDWVTASHYTGALSGAGSLEHNVVGHFFGSVLNNVAQGIGSVAGSALKRMGYSNPEIMTMSDFRNRMQGYADVLTTPSGTGKYPRIPVLVKDVKQAIKDNKIKGSGLDATGSMSEGPQLWKPLTYPQRLHTGSYAFFGGAEKAANLFQEGMRLAGKEGLEGKAQIARAKALANNPSKEMGEAALRDANSVNFRGQGDLSRALQAITAAKSAKTGLPRVFRFIFQNVAMFPGIAEQKFLSVAKYFPVIDRFDPYVRAQWADGARGKQVVLSRYMMGGTAMYMASQVDPTQYLPESLINEIPFVHAMVAARKATKQYQALTEKSSGSQIQDATEAVIAATAVFAKNLQDETFARSLSDFFVQNSRGGNSAKKYWGRMAASVIPISAGAREVAQHFDPTKRDTKSDTYTGTIANSVKANTPGLSKTLPEKAPSRYDLQNGDSSSSMTAQEYQALKGGKATPPASESSMTAEEYRQMQTEHSKPASTTSNEMSAEDYKKMSDNNHAKSKLEEMGYHVTDSGVRSRATQERYYATTSGVAKPGTSPHEDDRAIDVRPHKGASPEEIKKTLIDEGYRGVKVITKRHGTGPHWHVQWESS